MRVLSSRGQLEDDVPRDLVLDDSVDKKDVQSESADESSRAEDDGSSRDGFARASAALLQEALRELRDDGLLTIKQVTLSRPLLTTQPKAYLALLAVDVSTGMLRRL
jgi:hypothetical protein